LNKDLLKKIAYFVGKLLGVLGLLFVFYTLSQEYTLSSFMEKFSELINIFPLLFILNIISILIGIYAWHIMLLHYSKKVFPYMVSYYYFAKTEISKYLPGNIFHFVGRQALASKLNISQMQMLKISFLFTFYLITTTILSSTFFAFLSDNLPTYILISGIFSSIAIILIIIFSYPSFPIRKKIIMNMLLSTSVALQGIILGLIVVYQINSFDTSLFFQCASIYIISWLIGFITPGASGGLGVREGTFITIVSYLHIDISSDIIVFSVLLVRLINIFIDIIIYLSTFVLENKIKELKT